MTKYHPPPILTFPLFMGKELKGKEGNTRNLLTAAKAGGIGLAVAADAHT